jgi:hypothetical protein
VHLAAEGNHVVLAEGVNVDIAHDDHVAVRLLFKYTLSDDIFDCLAVALSEELKRLGCSLRCVFQAFTFGVLAQALQLGVHLQ